MTWDDSTIHMKDPESLMDLLNPVNYFFWNNNHYETDALQEASMSLQKILNVKYELVDLNAVVQVCRHLTKDEKHQLHAIVKHAHQMLGNLIRSFELQDNFSTMMLQTGQMSTSQFHKVTRLFNATGQLYKL